MAPASTPTQEPMYKKDEKVLCAHHELMYEAKVLAVQPKKFWKSDDKNPYEYKVHYKGWKNTWDDWVAEERLRKWTQENRDLATHLRNEMLAWQREARAKMATKNKARIAQEKAQARGSEERQTPAQSTGPRGQKRMRDQDLEKEEVFQHRRAVRITMPDRLKSLLVDDWENVTRSLQLVALPSKAPAGVVLDEYFKYATSTGTRNNAEMDILEEIIQGLKEYFSRTLGRVLLYRFEREQFHEIYQQLEDPTSELTGKTLSDIYGGEHLLRLFVSMPELIAQTNMDAQAVNRLREELSTMMAWLQKEPQVNAFFQSTYESPGQAYIDKVKSSI